MRAVLFVCIAIIASASAWAVACTSSQPAVPAYGYEGGAWNDATAGDAGADCNQPPMPDGAPLHLSGFLREHDAGPFVANTPILGEYGGSYVPYCDLGHASPFYVFGTVTDDAGRFEIEVREGKIGFHTFTTGYYYAHTTFDTATYDGSFGIDIAVRLPQDAQKPTITNAAFDKTTVKAGEQVRVSATVKAGSSADPLSDEVVIVEPTHSWGIELDPPAPAPRPDDFPDGLWSRTFAAPATAGTYTYWLGATSGGCVNGDGLTLTLVVQ